MTFMKITITGYLLLLTVISTALASHIVGGILCAPRPVTVGPVPKGLSGSIVTIKSNTGSPLIGWLAMGNKKQD